MGKVQCNVKVGTAKWRSDTNRRRWICGFCWFIKTPFGDVMNHDINRPRHFTRASAMKDGRAAAVALGFEIVRRKVTPLTGATHVR